MKLNVESFKSSPLAISIAIYRPKTCFAIVISCIFDVPS
jgi:hypothetical protein